MKATRILISVLAVLVMVAGCTTSTYKGGDEFCSAYCENKEICDNIAGFNVAACEKECLAQAESLEVLYQPAWVDALITCLDGAGCNDMGSCGIKALTASNSAYTSDPAYTQCMNWVNACDTELANCEADPVCAPTIWDTAYIISLDAGHCRSAMALNTEQRATFLECLAMPCNCDAEDGDCYNAAWCVSDWGKTWAMPAQ